MDTAGGVWILRRGALDMGYFANESEAIMALLKAAQKTALIAEAQEQFKLDEEFLNSIDIETLAHVV